MRQKNTPAGGRPDRGGVGNIDVSYLTRPASDIQVQITVFALLAPSLPGEYREVER